MVCNVARWVIAFGVVGAAVGLTVLGMGTSFVDPDDGMITIGLVLMVGGIVAAVIGAVVYRNSDEPDTSTR